MAAAALAAALDEARRKQVQARGDISGQPAAGAAQRESRGGVGRSSSTKVHYEGLLVALLSVATMDSGGQQERHAVSVSEYLELLQVVPCALGSVYGSRALFYLAAAVSDFYVPPERQAEHKIHSHRQGDYNCNPLGMAGGVGQSLELFSVLKKLSALVSM